MNGSREAVIAIIGGGVAGLCAAIELCKLGIKPTIIEAGNYPSHKVCGEFLSPESIHWLENLDISTIQINDVRFYQGLKSYTYQFPMRAGGLSHCILDPLLFERASSLGSEIFTGIKVDKFRPKQNMSSQHILELSNGETLKTSSIILATGNLSLQTRPKIKYVGIKGHFERISLNHSLHMFGFKNAYLGLSPVENEKTNLACLATIDQFNQAGSAGKLMAELIAKNPNLQELLSPSKFLFDDWMIAHIPAFGFKNTPNWLDSYFIGDAAMGIPPACGGGLSLAITSGIKAARYAAVKDFLGFKKDYHSTFSKPMRAAKGLHYLLMNPLAGKLAMQCCKLSPSIAHMLFLASRPA